MFSRTCAGYFHLARTASILQFSGRGGGKISIAISRGKNDHVQIIVCRVSLEVHPSLHGNNGIRVWGSQLRCWPIEPVFVRTIGDKHGRGRTFCLVSFGLCHFLFSGSKLVQCICFHARGLPSHRVGRLLGLC